MGRLRESLRESRAQDPSSAGSPSGGSETMPRMPDWTIVATAGI
ncbi:MAG: hypothetical protein JWR30_3789, partial [Conexibacter sp.]|nr:hypothetical protein [Conexibacter sp.]